MMSDDELAAMKALIEASPPPYLKPHKAARSAGGVERVWEDYKMIMGAMRDGLLDPVTWLTLATILIPTVAVALALRLLLA